MNYLLAGNNEFLKEEKLQEIKARAFSEGLHQGGLEQFDAIENNTACVLDAARTFPLFSSQRLILLREVDLLEETQLERLIAYLKQPQKTTTLVLLTQDEKISDSWLKRFDQLCEVGLFNTPYENQLESWIYQRVGQAGKKIHLEGARLLKELIGANLRVLAAEIQKLVLYVGRRSLITLEDVEQLVTQSIHYSSFLLGESLAVKDLPKTLSILSRLLQEHKSVPELIGLVYWQIQRMLEAKLKLEKGQTWAQVTQTLKISSPFLVRKFQHQLSNWNLAQLQHAVTSLLETDLAVKTGRWPATLALENWLIGVI